MLRFHACRTWSPKSSWLRASSMLSRCSKHAQRSLQSQEVHKMRQQHMIAVLCTHIPVLCKKSFREIGIRRPHFEDVLSCAVFPPPNIKENKPSSHKGDIKRQNILLCPKKEALLLPMCYLASFFLSFPKPLKLAVKVVPDVGFEPTTYWLQISRSTSWANPA